MRAGRHDGKASVRAPMPTLAARDDDDPHVDLDVEMSAMDDVVAAVSADIGDLDD